MANGLNALNQIPPGVQVPGAQPPQTPTQAPFPTAQPGAQIPGAVPTTDPQEIETRKSGWRQFTDRLKSDPALRQALLAFGAQALQPIQPGQTALGQFGTAVGAGAQTLSQQQALAGRQKLAERGVGAQEQIAGAQAQRAETAAAAEERAGREFETTSGIAQQNAASLEKVRVAQAKLAEAQAAQGGFAPRTQAAGAQLRDQIAQDLQAENPTLSLSQARLLADDHIARVSLDKFVQAAVVQANRDAAIFAPGREQEYVIAATQNAIAAWHEAQRSKGLAGGGAGASPPTGAPSPAVRKFNPATGKIE